ncbi:transporter substrate-binding domain-containing protein [Geoglobus acetivorans]|uniref:Transporter substrate-binding domain-containing protein n=1 Tax=Geoglobus acetivorans TaxID=565033 RepID=A0ABZ3H3B8_GEOAI|nr:transporter substrate-binding domain-containing protein [Geoglobus acetivorans]
MKPAFLTLILLIFLILPVTAVDVKVGVYNNPPLVFYENGEAKGLFIDILEYVAKKEGWKIEYVHSTFPVLLDKLQKGEIDLMPDVAYSQERAETLSFGNETVISNWGVVCGRSGIDSILDLDGLTIAGVKDDVYFENLKELTRSFGLECDFVDVVGDYGDVLEAVKNKKADVGVVSRLFGEMYCKKYGLKMTPIVFSPVELKFASPKGKEHLLRAIDFHLAELKNNSGSIYYSSLDKWVGGYEEEEIPKWVYIGFSILAVVSIFALYKEYYIKKELKKRERQLIRAYRLLKRISRINELMLKEKDLDTLVRKSVDVLGDYLNVMVVVFSDDGVVAYGGGARTIKSREDLSKYLCIKGALDSMQMRHYPPERHPRNCPHVDAGGRFHSYVFPMMYEGKIRGVMAIQSKSRLTGREVRLLETLAEDIAFAVHSIEVEREKDLVLKQLDKNIRHMMTLVDRIRNPLTAIRGFSEMFCQNVFEKVDVQIERILDIVRKVEESWEESENLKERLKKTR